jgi:hypothetical protein
LPEWLGSGVTERGSSAIIDGNDVFIFLNDSSLCLLIITDLQNGNWQRK